MGIISDKSSAFAAQEKLSIIQLLLEIPNCICLMISALLSKSILVWVDLIDSTNSLCRAIFVAVLMGKLKKNLSYQYNYGTGKIEAIASLCCDVLQLISLGVVAVFAVNDLLHPSQPSGMLILIVLLKVQNVTVDTYIWMKQRKNWVDSKIYHSEFAANTKNLLFDTGLMIIFIITYFGRNLQWAGYVSPAFSLVLAAMLIYYTVLRMYRAMVELMDATCDEETQCNIVRVLVALYDYYDEFLEVKSRRNADQLLIDIYLRFKPETTYEQISQFAKIASEKLGKLTPNCVVSIVIQER